MANEEQLKILRKGVEPWNEWRAEYPNIFVDLREANLTRTDLAGANLRDADIREANFLDANLSGANLRRANLMGSKIFAKLKEANLSSANLRDSILSGADLSNANLSGAHLDRAHLTSAKLTATYLRGAVFSEATSYGADFRNSDLSGAVLFSTMLMDADFREANLQGTYLGGSLLMRANFSGANLRKANLSMANLAYANLSNADLSNANLSGSNLVQVNIDNSEISQCKVYGISVWDLEGEFKEQEDLIITPQGAPVVTVDNLKVAQFVYLILNNKEIRDVLNILTSKAVLILGRFGIPERKAILDALRNKLREYNLLPIVFDFDRPTDKDFTETIKTLAGISCFVIADVTNPKSSPLELQATVPDYQIPFVPIIQEGESPFAMMVDLQKKYPWVLPTKSYDSIETLMKALKPGIIDPAVEMHNKLRLIKAQEQKPESLRDYLDKTL